MRYKSSAKWASQGLFVQDDILDCVNLQFCHAHLAAFRMVTSRKRAMSIVTTPPASLTCET